MPQREVEICARVRLFRKEHLKWSQPTFAKELGIDSFYLSNLEQGRTPLRYPLARSILKHFPLNVHWLANGDSPMILRLPPPPPVEEVGANERSLFSCIYDEKLADLGFLERQAALRDLTGSVSVGLDDGSDPASRFAAYLSLSIDLYAWLAQVPDSRFREFVKVLQLAAANALTSYPKEPVRDHTDRDRQMRALRDAHSMRMFVASRAENRALTFTEEWLNTDSVARTKSLVRELIEKVKEATTERGSRTRLAEFLGVTPQRLNDWLSGEHEPSAETTLRLLAWVTHQAENQKAPGRVTSTPEGHKTQQAGNHANENRKSGPKSPPT